MDRRACAFTGHRPDRFAFRYREDDALCRKIKEALLEQAALLYGKGVRCYLVGGAQGVDLWAGEAVLALRERFADVELVCAVPFTGFDSRWSEGSRKRLARLLSQCASVPVICARSSPDAYKRRNYYMVDHAAYLVAVYDNDRSIRSGTGQTVNYAKKMRREIIFLHPDTGEVYLPSAKK